MKIFYNILVFIALAVIVFGVLLFFREHIYSIPVMISGFLLLSIHTVSLINFKKNLALSIFQVLTILLFVVVAGFYLWKSPFAYFLLLLAIFFQMLIAIWNLSKKRDE